MRMDRYVPIAIDVLREHVLRKVFIHELFWPVYLLNINFYLTFTYTVHQTMY